MSEKRKVIPAIVVEGKYDKIRLEAVVDAVILVTDGFRIYKRPEQLALLRHYAETTGLVILTDADAAGFQIRGYLKGAIPQGKVYQVYIPGIHGKEPRKTAPSAEGLLGVEGMTPDLLRTVFAPFLSDSPARPAAAPITKTDLFSLGLSGKADSAKRRAELARSLGLPADLPANALLDALNVLFTRDRFLAQAKKTDL